MAVLPRRALVKSRVPNPESVIGQALTNLRGALERNRSCLQARGRQKFC